MNMPHCRFRNTLRDLEACREALDQSLTDLSPSEKEAAKRLILLCDRIAKEALYLVFK